MNDFNFFDIPQFARQRSKDFVPAKLQGCHTLVATAVITGSQILAPASPQYKSWTVAGLDADTTLAFNHGFTVNGVATAPDLVILTPLVSYANAALPNWGVAVSATQITLTKTAATASATGLGNILKVYAEAPHSVAE